MTSPKKPRGAKVPKFDRDFQRRLLRAFVSSPETASFLAAILRPEYFDQRYRPGFVKLVETWTEHRIIPSKELFSETTGDRPLAQAIFKRKPLTDLSAILAHVADFARQNEVKFAILRWAERVGNPNADVTELVNDFRHAVAVGENAHENEVSFLHAEIKKFALDYAYPRRQNRLPTGLYHLDVAMRGGAGRGEINVVMGCAKSGKSSLLVNIAWGAIAGPNGLKVAFYTLELSEEEVWKRIHRRIAGKGYDYMVRKPKAFSKSLLRRARLFTGDLFVKYFRSINATQLEAHLERVISAGFKPDIVIVDYGNLLKSELRGKERREHEAAKFGDLRRMANHFDVAVWSATQANRAAINRITLGQEHVGESYEIVQLIDGLITISATKQEKAEKRCRLFGAAGRCWPDGFSIDCREDLDLCAFQTVGFTKRSSAEDDDDLGDFDGRADRKRRD